MGSSLLAAGAGVGPFAGGIKIGTRLNPQPTEEDLDFFRQNKIEFATVWTTLENANYDYFRRIKQTVEGAGIELLNVGILDLHCDPDLVLGLPGRDRKIELYQQYLRDLGRAGIQYTTYAHMANIKMAPYYQTGRETLRGATQTRVFDETAAAKLPLSHDRAYSDEEVWKTLTHFLRAAMPVAEKAKVRIGLHPDDPPMPSLGGVARVIRDASGYQRAIDIADSDHFGLCFCVGTWAEGGQRMDKDVYEMIRHFGPKGRIFKVHFRNVDQPLPRFREVFVDEGYIDMYRVMQLLRETGFRGVLIPDHVPGEGVRGPGTAYTVGYMRALRDRALAS